MSPMSGHGVRSTGSKPTTHTPCSCLVHAPGCGELAHDTCHIPCACPMPVPRCRSLEHSTIVYEVEPAKPLIQMSWNKMDENYIAVLEMEATAATVIDIRCVPTCVVCLYHPAPILTHAPTCRAAVY